MRYIGVDPGSQESGVVVWHRGVIRQKAIMPNTELVERLAMNAVFETKLVVEMFGVAGMCGQETFDACVWIGHFERAWGARPQRRMFRREVYRELLGGSTGNDSLVRQALIARLGEPGKAKAPGPLYGVKKHEWSALALAVVAEILDERSATLAAFSR